MTKEVTPIFVFAQFIENRYANASIIACVTCQPFTCLHNFVR